VANLRRHLTKDLQATDPEPIPQLVKTSAVRGLHDLPRLVAATIFEARTAEARGRSLRKLDLKSDRLVPDRSN
jgi:hypothetical protein